MNGQINKVLWHLRQATFDAQNLTKYGGRDACGDDDWLIIDHPPTDQERVNFNFFVQLGFNLNNRVTDTLESSATQIYSDEHMSLYTQKDSLN